MSVRRRSSSAASPPLGEFADVGAPVTPTVVASIAVNSALAVTGRQSAPNSSPYRSIRPQSCTIDRNVPNHHLEDMHMNRRSLAAAVAMTALASGAAFAAEAQKADTSNMEKCYGVAHAGKNDC